MAALPVSPSTPKKVHLDLTSSDLECLIGENWVNDKIIISYLDLITFRAIMNPNLPKVTHLDPTFMERFCNWDPSPRELQRWTRKMNIFEYEIVLIPFYVNSNHWTLICIDFMRKTVGLYDSSQTIDDFTTYGEAVLDFVRMEATARKQIDLLNSLDTWRVLTEERWPRQNNINDSGIFLCLYAEALSLRAPPIFNTKFMNLQRVKIMIELLQSSLEEPNYDLSYYVNDAKNILKQGSRQLGWMPGVTYID